MSREINRIRVLHTLCRINSGGVEQRRLLLARGLPKDRYEHRVICQDTGGLLPELLRAEGWQINKIGTAPHILSPSWHNGPGKLRKTSSQISSMAPLSRALHLPMLLECVALAYP